jgi:four helix bundle protein
MKYSRFEDLPVWKASSRLFAQVDALCDDRPLRCRGDLADQLHRASLSISNNIAEGFELGTTQQLISHLYIARGSAGEVRSMLLQIEQLPRLDHLKSQISDLKSQAKSISRQLRGWADSLQNSPIEGQRYLTEAQRHADDRRARRDAFNNRLETLVAGARNRHGQPADVATSAPDQG